MLLSIWLELLLEIAYLCLHLIAIGFVEAAKHCLYLEILQELESGLVNESPLV